MIGILNVILIILFLVAVPLVLGLLLEGIFVKAGEDFMLSRCFVLGIELMAASFGILGAPFILIGTSFTALLYAWEVLLFALVVVSIAINAKKIKDIFSSKVKSLKDLLANTENDRKYLMLLVLFMIIFQTSLLVLRMHVDTDDSRFIAEAVDAVENNSLLRIHPITGAKLSEPLGEMNKDVFASYPILIGALSVMTKVQPAVLSHSIFPIFLIPLSYAAMFILGDYFFGNTKKRTIFMYVLSIVLLFSFESIYSLGYTLLTIIWQGRSIYTMILLPFSWYLLMKIYTEDNRKHLYILFLITSIAAMCLSGTGALCQIILAVAFALAIIVKNRNIISAILIGLCVVPCGISSVYFKLAKILGLLGIK